MAAPRILAGRQVKLEIAGVWHWVPFGAAALAVLADSAVFSFSAALFWPW